MIGPMSITEPAGWRKSSASNFSGNCVEVAQPGPEAVMVRDTKDRDGGTLAFPGGAWQAFTDAIKDGQLTR
jgi:hypothetical protein